MYRHEYRKNLQSVEFSGEKTTLENTYPPVNKHSNGNSPSWIGNTSSNGGFSIAMLDYRSVSFNHVFFHTKKKAPSAWCPQFPSRVPQKSPVGRSCQVAMIATKTIIISTKKMTTQLKLNMCVCFGHLATSNNCPLAFFLLGVQTWNLALSASRFFFNSLKPAIWDQDTTQLPCIFREVEVWHPHKTMLELMKQYSVLTEYHSFAATTLAKSTRNVESTNHSMCKLHPILQKTNNLQLPPQPIFFEPKISKEMAPLLAPPKRALKVWREVWVEKKKIQWIWCW